ncbi:MAG: hypothetical protein ABL882_09995 [Sphingopyxis sp.]
MSESLAQQLSVSASKEELLRAVAAEDIDQIPLEFGDHARFLVCAVRAVAKRADQCDICVFVHSDAPRADAESHGFSRISHMQDGNGELADRIVLTNRDAYNGFAYQVANGTIDTLIDEIERLSFGTKMAVIWDGQARVATFYPEGVASETVHNRLSVPVDDGDLSQDEVCAALNLIYQDNLSNPSGRTLKLWSDGKLIRAAEDEIERQIKGQMYTYFAGQSRPIKVLSQTHTTAGRCDLVLAQKQQNGKLQLSGVIELKVLRGPQAKDIESTKEGLSQGYHYRMELGLPFATLALFDVSASPNNDDSILTKDQHADHVAEVRVRRFPIYNSPQAWRNAQAA